jgi:hypothetical protein
MSENKKEDDNDYEKPSQQISFAGGDSKQVGRDNYESNQNLVISVFFLSVLALGGLAWAFTFGVNQSKQAPKIEKNSQPQ